jgi:hypothetical protein
MISDSYGDEIVDELGEKVLYGIASAVQATKRDLREYREAHPAWAAQQTERGLANWLHDWLWAHLLEELSALPGVVFAERGPTREFRVGMRYLFRAKRHSAGDRISSFPTPTSLAFWSQRTGSLFPDAEEVRLAVGYRWDRDLRQIEDAVISLRDSTNDPVWAVTVGFVDDAGTIELRPLQADAPELPIITLAEEDDTGGEGRASSE